MLMFLLFTQTSSSHAVYFVLLFCQAHFPGPPVQDLSAPQRASISKLTAKETASPASTATSSAAL